MPNGKSAWRPTCTRLVLNPNFSLSPLLYAQPAMTPIEPVMVLGAVTDGIAGQRDHVPARKPRGSPARR